MMHIAPHVLENITALTHSPPSVFLDSAMNLDMDNLVAFPNTNLAASMAYAADNGEPAGMVGTGDPAGAIDAMSFSAMHLAAILHHAAQMNCDQHELERNMAAQNAVMERAAAKEANVKKEPKARSRELARKEAATQLAVKNANAQERVNPHKLNANHEVAIGDGLMACIAADFLSGGHLGQSMLGLAQDVKGLRESLQASNSINVSNATLGQMTPPLSGISKQPSFRDFALGRAA